MVACHLKSYRPDLGYKTITGEAYKHVPLKLWRDCLLTLNDFQKLLGDINWIRPHLKLNTADLKPCLIA